MLIETSVAISPLASIGIAVRITSSGGGIKNGLNSTVDSTCQMQNAMATEAAESSAVRSTADDGRGRAARDGGEVSPEPRYERAACT